MKKIVICVLFVLLIAMTVGCSKSASSERLANEAKLQKVAENMGVDSKTANSNLKNLSDEDLAKAAKYVKEDGTIDAEKAIQDAAAEESQKNEIEANKLPLREIQVDCEVYQDPASKKFTNTLINLKGCAEDGEKYGCKGKSNLAGSISIKLFSLREKQAEGYSYYKEFTKGNQLAEITGQINSVMTLTNGSGGLFFGNSKAYQLTITPKKIDTTKIEYATQDKESDEYGRKYARVPFAINAKFTDSNGKEYMYNSDVSDYSYTTCEIVSEMVINNNSTELYVNQIPVTKPTINNTDTQYLVNGIDFGKNPQLDCNEIQTTISDSNISYFCTPWKKPACICNGTLRGEYRRTLLDTGQFIILDFPKNGRGNMTIYWNCKDGKEYSYDDIQRCADNLIALDILKPIDFAMNDSITAGDFTWKFTSFRKQAKIGKTYGDNFIGKMADGEYYIVDVEVTNTGKRAQYLSSSAIVLIDNQRREFSSDSLAALYLDSSIGENSLNFATINPGITKHGEVVFDVPKGLTVAKIRITSNLIENSFRSVTLFG